MFSLPQAVFWEVRVGEHNQKLTETSEKTYTVSRVFHYPWYRGYDNDMALMKLSKPIDETEYASPVCMPADANVDFADRECVATGWGKVDYSKFQSHTVFQCAKKKAFKFLARDYFKLKRVELMVINGMTQSKIEITALRCKYCRQRKSE